ncbi:MAG: endolytic transglycosylase MltG [Gemmatimonadota bacterium]
MAVGLLVTGCSGQGQGEPVRILVPQGASFGQVTDSLAAHDIVEAPPLFRVYARLSGAATRIQPGTYEFRPGTTWGQVLTRLEAGDVLTARVVVPEASDLERIAPRIALATGLEEDSVFAVLMDTAAARRWDVPGPTLEGYLYPATYTVPVDAPLASVVDAMVAAYKQVWTPERRARADSLGMSEREVVTLASIVEWEAKLAVEMPRIAAVYHNRLRIGLPLQADPTVQYALGEHQARLLYAHIDSVADHPYNTYRIAGLPPGPIASPSARGIDATLNPANDPALYFVARPDGSHVFTRSLEEHNRARAEIRREQAATSGNR